MIIASYYARSSPATGSEIRAVPAAARWHHHSTRLLAAATCLTRDNSRETHFVVIVTGTKLFPSAYHQRT